MIRCDHVTKRFGRSTVLDDVSLQIDQGDSVSLIGPSGAGKTTLLRIVQGLDRSDAGRVIVLGQALSEARRGQARAIVRGVGTVFQALHLFPHLDVLGNVVVALTDVQAMSRPDAEARGSEALSALGLADKLHRYPAELSHGQAQRVALARAVVLQPKVLLLDEVTSALDYKLTTHVAEWLDAFRRRNQTTLLFATHDLTLVRLLANNTLVLEAGRVVASGITGEVIDTVDDERIRAVLHSIESLNAARRDVS